MFRLTTLGVLDLRDGRGRPLRELLAQPKRVALLVYLAIEGAKGPVSRDALLALFWPESDDTRARNALSQSLHHIRQALGGDVLQSQGSAAVTLDLGALWCDATAFADAVERGEAELALDLYRGEFCPTLFVSGAPAAEEWLDTQRRRLRGQVLAAAQGHAQRLLDRGDPDAAARLARRALALAPDDEAIVRALLGIMDKAGETTGALLAYQDYERRLAQAFGAQPESRTRQLIAAIRARREPSPAVEAEAAPLAAVSANAEAPEAARRTEQRRRSLVLAGLLGLATISGLVAWRFSRVPAGGAAPRTIAVFPFSVRSPNLAYLREGMMDLLSAKLEGIAGLQAVDPRSVIAANPNATDPASASAVTRRLGGGRFVTGDVVESAGRLQVTASLYEVGARRSLASATVSGDTTHLFELVDDLAGRILAGLVQGRDSSITRLAALTTTSLPALKAFLEGEQAMRAGHDAVAATAFREAVDLDSGFALAEYRLALSSTWVMVPGIQNNAQVVRMAELAERQAQRLAPLVRDLLSAYRAYKDFDPGTAEMQYRRLAQTHPDNVEAWFMLGETLFHYNGWRGRSPMEARAAFERVLALDPANAHAALHLARLAARDGDTAGLDSLGRVYLSRHQGAERTLEMRALLAGVHGDSAERRQVLDDAAASDALVLFSVLQSFIDYSQSTDAARTMAGTFLRSATEPVSRLMGRRLLTTVPLANGQWSRQDVESLLGKDVDRPWLRESEALLAATPLAGIPRQRIAALRDSITRRSPYPIGGYTGLPPDSAGAPDYEAWLRGVLSVRLGDLDPARAALALLARAPSGGRATIAHDLATSLRSAIARADGHGTEAISELESFNFTAPGARGSTAWGTYERFMMAELLHEAGRDSLALGWYASFPAGFDFPWVPMAHLRQGQIYERLGNRERARFHYGRAAAIWRDADQDVQPLLALARQGLERVRGS